MAKKKSVRGKNSGSESGWLKFGFGLVQLATTIIDRFGWPGLLLMLAGFYLEAHGTDAQKQEVIDRLILWKEVPQHGAAVSVIVVLLLVMLAQHTYYRRRIKLQDEELRRVGEEKSRLQEKQIGQPLNHRQIVEGV